MKKILVFALVLMLGVMGLAGCSGSQLADAGFSEASEGAYTLVDTQSSPLPEGGVKIDVTTGAGGSVKFTVTDSSGTATVDYYEFIPAENTMHRHRYVAGMGATYNYYFDYSKMELVKVTDADGQDVSDGLKMAGRWDSAQTETKDHAGKLISYFKDKYGMTIDDAVGE